MENLQIEILHPRLPETTLHGPLSPLIPHRPGRDFSSKEDLGAV